MNLLPLITALSATLVEEDIAAVCKWRPDTVRKAWTNEGSASTYFEGWLATPDVDADGELTEPEAFIPVLDGYARLNMPLTSEHETEPLPVGHLQRMAVLRDGVVLKSAQHPTDSADFAYLPTTGSGVWVRGVVNTPSHAHAVANGNLGGMSFIAGIKDADKPGTHPRKLKEFSALWETTLAAYPRNRHAVVQRAMKAYIPQETPPAMTKEELEAILAKFAPQAAAPAAEATPEYVTKAALDTALADALKAFATQFGEQVKASVEETVQKALPAPNREGTGRVGETTAAPTGEDAVTALIKKAGNAAETLSFEDKDMILALSAKAFVGDLLSDTGNRK